MRDGWVETTLIEVAELVMGQSPPGDTYNRDGVGIPFIQGSAEFGTRSPVPVQWCSAPKKLARVGDLLVSVRAPVGDLNVADQPIAIGRGLAVVRATSASTTPFLGLAIQQGLPALRRRSTGGMFDSITKEGLSGLPLLLPPLEEQRRIVDLIESIDAYIAALEAEEAALAATRSNLLGELLTRGGDDWIETTLGAIGDWYSGSTPKATNPAFYGGDIPFVAIGDLHGGLITRTERKLTSAGVQQIGRTAPPGAVFLSMYGSIGKVGMASCEMATNQAITWIECDSQVCTSQFVLMWLSWRSSEFDSQGRGATQRNINREMVKSTALQLPPLEEQRRIIDLVESVDTTIADAAGARQSAVALRRATLGALLSGDHEIPSSYDDLLETV